MSFKVYWTANGQPKSKDFQLEEMTPALNFMEALRNQQLAGESINFVTLSSENKNSVGRAGVAEVSADYNWKKRRQ